MTIESQHKENRSSTIALWVGGVSFVFTNLALLCFKLGQWPWAVNWIENGALGSVVLLTLDSIRYEMVALLLVSLNLMFFVLRRSRTGSNITQGISLFDEQKHTKAVDVKETTDKEPQKPEVSALEQLLQDELVSEPGSVAKDSPDASVEENTGLDMPADEFSAEIDKQMQIALAEISRLRGELGVREKQLQIANEAKSQFLANMSHELRTPMNGIMGMTDLLLGSSLAPREERFIRSISSSSTTLLSIINDLLDYSKIQSGILQLEHARFSVRDCLEDVCTSLASRAQEKGIELICYVDDNVPVQMDGDPARVRQIIKNLVSNAIAFTDTGEVVVRLKRSEEDTHAANGKSTYQCDVQDTGIGISPEMQQQLFEAFSQGDESSTRGHGGLGMGLAITRQLVAMMYGEISFRSRLGDGSRFSFTMDLDDVNVNEDGRARRRSLSGARVLVVDDNETNRTILYHQLSNWGLVVECAASGLLALEALRDAHDRDEGFDVLVLDLHMPHMDGIQLAKAIQLEQDFNHIQSIMLTSAILQIDASELELLGVYKYVSKPARQSVLHDSLASLMPYVGSSTDKKKQRPESDLKHLPKVNARVLLAEDNPVNQDVALSMLEQLGCSVELATDGVEAVSKSETEKFDILLMDCQMPIMDGYEASRAIKSGSSINAHTPIIALTANAMEGDRDKCLNAGMDDYISKPVRTKYLMLVLEKWVNEAVDTFEEDVHSQTPALISSGFRDGDLPAHVIDAVSAGVSIEDIDSDFYSIQSQRLVGIESPSESETAVQEDDEVINLKAITTIRELQRPGKPDLLHKVVNVYFDKTPQVIADMQLGLDINDYALVSASAHSLKSSSAYLGADILSVHCKAVEAAIHDETYDDLPTFVRHIATDYSRVEVALKALIEYQDKAA